MIVFVNSQEHQVPVGISVLNLLELLGLAEKRVAVEINGELVLRAQWQVHVLNEGDRLEVVTFVGGG